MRRIRVHRLARLIAVTLFVWMVADVMSHGACTHDFGMFSGAAAQVNSGSDEPGRPSHDDVNHCSCHWQFLPAPAVMLAEAATSSQVIQLDARRVPQADRQNLDPPPQPPSV